ncbi:MAG TPA: Xaa-Pro peptidase family protein [Thermomicrobiales bacterium]|nr:Xaa-Pro peptidase family protein [Thermomicrobiales bacterium]
MATEELAMAGVYHDRLERAQEQLRQQEVDMLLVGPSADLVYLIGFEAHESERLNLLLLPREGDPVMVMPVLESPLLRDRGAALELNITTWTETQSPTELVAQLAGDMTGKTVAVSDTLWSMFLLRLQRDMTGARWIGAGGVMRPLRVIKDGREIELMQEVSRRTDDAWTEFLTQPLSGQTEAQAMARLAGLMADRRLGEGFGICASGPNSASPHHQAGDRVIQPGDAVLFDFGGTLEGYNSDITRTVHIGPPSDEFVKVYNIVLEANQAVLDAVRPGVPCEALDEVARNIISNAGYGDFFIHRVGHGLGLEIHEEPYLVEGNSAPLESGMIFSDEPGIYLEGRFGIRIEDAVRCTDTGGERLNEASRELMILE